MFTNLPRVRPCNRLQKFGSSGSSFSRYFENLSLVRQKEEITRLTECVTVDNQSVVPVRVKSNFTHTCFLKQTATAISQRLFGVSRPNEHGFKA